jgi:hypothetical protein
VVGGARTIAALLLLPREGLHYPPPNPANRYFSSSARMTRKEKVREKRTKCQPCAMSTEMTGDCAGPGGDTTHQQQRR